MFPNFCSFYYGKIYKCQTISDMNLIARLKKLVEHDLCVRCLRKSHAGRCANKRNNRVFPRCLPEISFYDCLISPNAHSSVDAAMKATGCQRKRKNNDNRQQNAKRKGRNNANGNR